MTLDQLVQLMDPQLYLHLQTADSTNFFFFFRMLLVWFKREFEWVDILRLWESLWTDWLSSSFHLFIALAILEKHRDVIMDHLKHFDEVLKYINELSNTIDLIPILSRAEGLFHRFQRIVEAVDKKNNFPAPAIRHRRLRSDPTSPSRFSNTAPDSSDLSDFRARPLDVAKPRSESTSRTGGSVGNAASGSIGTDKTRIISTELRQLLTTTVTTMDGREVREHGGGIR